MVPLQNYRNTSYVIEVVQSQSKSSTPKLPPVILIVVYHATLGVQLVMRIVRSQLRGSSSVENENGLKWRILFRDDLYTERV